MLNLPPAPRLTNITVHQRAFSYILAGHFMGKKSVMDSPLLPAAEGQGIDALEVTLPAEQSALGELFQDFLRVALRTQVDPQESRSKDQVSSTSEPPVLERVRDDCNYDCVI